jgi:acetolactate synthase-1/2/3 large subunit
MLTISEIIALKLKNAGISHIFGLPGGENVPILSAIATQGINFVLVHNESSAVYMADAYARITGKPGVCLVTLGPGLMNAMAGIGHAYLDRSPVLIITACVWDELRPHHTHQYLDQTAIIASTVKRTMTLTPANVHGAMDDALTLTMAGRPGPVHVQVSKQVAGMPAIPAEITTNPSSAVSSNAPIANIASLTRAKNTLAAAKRPVIVVGLGLEPERPYTELLLLAERANMPVIVTPKGKGAIPSEHDCYAGTFGLTHTDPVYEILDEADCILAVGFDVVELVKPWQTDAPLIWLAPWANEDPAIPAVVELVDALKPLLSALSQLHFDVDPAWGVRRIATFRAKQAQKQLPDPMPTRINPQTVLQALADTLPEDTLVTTDVGSHKILTSLMWQSQTPNRFMLSNGLSCMGFGLPAAIAGSLALDLQPTVAITGDGGMAMVLGELELITRLNTPVIMVVMNDNALDLIRSAQKRAGEAVLGTEFGNPDFMKIAEAYGIAGKRVATQQECVVAVEQALRNRAPILIEALIDPASYPTTPTR